MKAVISSTYDDKYLFFLPIVTWCWRKLDVDTICFLPQINVGDIPTSNKFLLVLEAATEGYTKKGLTTKHFVAPEHKQATYAQCSRLYAACLDLPAQEFLVTSDIDMAIFQRPQINEGFTVFGADLVPPKQVPMCYLSAAVGEWREVFGLNGKTYQQCLDELLGDIECEGFRGNYWGKDQEEAWNKISKSKGWVHYEGRAKGDTQFASRRYDRDDSFILDRLDYGTIDYHLNRPGYLEENFSIILKILQFHYPTEDFTWLINFRNEYIQLL